MDDTPNHLLCLGFGYVAGRLAEGLVAEGWQVTGTNRAPGPAPAGVRLIQWPGGDDAALETALKEATHIVSSVPPREAGDPVLALLDQLAARTTPPEWVALLSTTGVYGDQGGAWVDETAPTVPASHRGARRAAQETAWRALSERTGLPVHIFRLAGIYGPGRSPLDRVREGRARRIVKPGQVFSRIHVSDIVAILRASIARPNPGAIYNVADDKPAPPQDVLAEAATLLGLPIPPDEPFETAEMTEMARSFYADNKRIANGRIKDELGVRLRYPDYHQGLRALLDEDDLRAD